MEKNVLIKKIAVFIIAFIGFLTTIKLAVIYYDANFNPYALPSFCSVNELIDCDGVARTVESQFFGVPLALWGMFFYVFVMVLLLADKLKKFILFRFLEVFKNPLDYIALLGVFSFCVSMCLLCVSLFEINKICVLCAFTYVLNLLIGLISIDYKGGGLMKAFKQSIADFKDAISKKAYLIALIVVVLFGTGGLSYASSTNVLAPQVKYHRELGVFIHAKTNKYAVSGNYLGDKNADKTIYIYTDYNCPFCGAFDIMIHKAVRELKGYKVVHKNLPLDTECNKFLKRPFHEGSCTMARYAIAAEKQDKFWDIDAKFFEKHPATEDDILVIAKNLGLNVVQLQNDASSPDTYARLKKDIEEAYASGVNATPTMVINGKVMVGISPYPSFIEDIKKAGDNVKSDDADKSDKK